MRQFRHLLSAALLIFTGISTATDLELRPEHPDRYTVVPGDTLWDISGHFLQSPWRWPEIWEVNPEVRNPHLIYPGDILYLRFVDGKPRLSREPNSGGMRDVRLSPGVRRSSLSRAIPVIPIDAIQQFLTRPRVMSRYEIQQAPEVTAFVQEHIVGGIGDPFYASSIEDDLNRSFDVIRPGKPYRDPDTGENLGHEALYVGDAELLRAGTPAKMTLTGGAMEVQMGDRVLPDPEEETLEQFYPKPAPEFVDGKILAVLNGINQIGQYNVVVLNKGSADGLEIGDVMQILQRSRPPRSAQAGTLWGHRNDLPLETVGMLLIFRPFERVSYALVMSASGVIHLKDTVRSPRN